MSKRKNRLLREAGARYRLSRNADYIAGALASDVPDVLAPAGTRPKGGDCEAGSMRSTSDAVTGEAGQAPTPTSLTKPANPTNPDTPHG